MRHDTKSWAWHVPVVTLAMVVVGCGPTTLDTSSLDNLENSLTALREPLELDERDRFDEALTYLVGGGAILNDETQRIRPGIVLALYQKTLEEIRTTGGLALDRPPRAAGQG